MPEVPVTEVVAGILRDAHGRVLLSRRKPGTHLAGTWEFPGGKLHPDEPPETGLARELAEELGVEVRESRPLLTIMHPYPEKTVRLWIRDVNSWSGQPCGVEQQELRWVGREALGQLDMPPADRPVIRVLELDPEYCISPDPSGFSDRAAFLDYWSGQIDRGAGLLQLRAHHVDDRELAALARECGKLARAAGVRWLLNTDPETALALGADGIHLTAARLRALNSRPLPAELLVAASCHSRAELEQAARIGADFATLSPVSATPGHTAVEPLGWEEFGGICASTRVPVYALGGVTPGKLDKAREHGAYGVAGIRAFGP